MNSRIIFLLTIATVCCAAYLTKEEIFAKAVGPCIADKCQSKHSCYFGQCVPEGIHPPMPRLNKADSVGPCLNGMCPGDNFCHEAHCYKP